MARGGDVAFGGLGLELGILALERDVLLFL